MQHGKISLLQCKKRNSFFSSHFCHFSQGSMIKNATNGIEAADGFVDISLVQEKTDALKNLKKKQRLKGKVQKPSEKLKL